MTWSGSVLAQGFDEAPGACEEAGPEPHPNPHPHPTPPHTHRTQRCLGRAGRVREPCRTPRCLPGKEAGESVQWAEQSAPPGDPGPGRASQDSGLGPGRAGGPGLGAHTIGRIWKDGCRKGAARWWHLCLKPGLDPGFLSAPPPPSSLLPPSTPPKAGPPCGWMQQSLLRPPSSSVGPVHPSIELGGQQLFLEILSASGTRGATPSRVPSSPWIASPGGIFSSVWLNEQDL